MRKEDKGGGIMERLTIDEVIEHCNKTCDMTEKIAKARGHELESIESNQFWEHYQVRAWLKELKQYKNLEEQGLLLRLPCKVGDDIYVIPSEVNYRLNKSFGAKGLNLVCMQVVDHIEFNSYGYLVSTNEGMTVHRQEAFGETWFLTREEAEQKLKEMERG